MNADPNEALQRAAKSQQQLTILIEALMRAVPELERTLRDVVEEISADPRASPQYKNEADELYWRLIHRNGRELQSGLSR